MNDQQNINMIINNCKDSDKTFAEFIFELLKEKYVEIYLGDSYEDIKFEQVSTSQPAIFCGKVVGAYKECLIIDAVNVENNQLITGNITFINERSIRALTQLDSNGSIDDLFLKSNESKKIKKFLGI